mmetsp:Transcript_1893/g.4182  ORF Transcript_1893/g.4182 Transcript_1893/m.4182 type:complete len:962 (-) Transcript_1893:56-2941(-)
MNQALDAEQSRFMQSNEKPAAKLVRTQAPPAPKPTRVSLFAKRMGIQHRDELKGDESVVLEVAEKKDRSWKEVLELHQTGFPEVVKLTKEELRYETRREVRVEASVPNDIHLENLQKVKSMTPEEVKQACQELESNIPAELLENLRERGRRKLKGTLAPKADEVKPTCLHDDAAPTLRVEKLRFNIEGRVVQEYSDDQWGQTDEQGMSIKELGLMCRSSLPNQRTLALETLNLLMLMESPLTHAEMVDYLVEQSKIAITLFSLLEDANLNVRLAALRLTHSLLCLYLETNFTVQDFDWLLFPTCLSSGTNGLLIKAERNAAIFDEEAEVRHPKESKDEDLTDFELSQFDLTGVLVRMGLLGRVMQIYCDRPETQDLVLEILLAVALHSVSGCYTIMRCQGLLEDLISEGKFPSTLLRLLSTLGKASHSTAFAVNKLLKPFVSELTAIVSRQDKSIAMKALKLHISLLDYKFRLLDFEFMRALAMETLRAGVIDDAFAASLLQCIVKESELFGLESQCIGLVELCLFSGLQAASNPKLLEQMLGLIRVYLTSRKSLPNEGSNLTQQLENLLTQNLFEVQQRLAFKAPLPTSRVLSPKSVRRLDKEFSLAFEAKSANTLKAALELFELFDIVLQFELGLGRTYLSQFNTTVSEFQSAIEPVLSEVVNLHNADKKIPALSCYRLKPLVRLYCCILNLRHKLQLPPSNTSALALHFLQSYDEHLAEQLLLEQFESANYAPLYTEYFAGLLTSEANLKTSRMLHLHKPGLASHFLCNKESRFLPFSFDFYYNFKQCPTHLVPTMLSFLAQAEHSGQLSFIPASLKIEALNSLFNDEVEVPEEFDKVASELASKPEFWESITQCKDSVLQFADYYVSNSYCNLIASKWLICFLTPEVHYELRRNLHEKLEGLLPRIANSVGTSFYGPRERYTKIDTDWRLVRLYQEVEPSLERGTWVQTMVASMLGR